MGGGLMATFFNIYTVDGCSMGFNLDKVSAWSVPDPADSYFKHLDRIKLRVDGTDYVIERNRVRPDASGSSVEPFRAACEKLIRHFSGLPPRRV
jgi:hypothetical protein